MAYFWIKPRLIFSFYLCLRLTSTIYVFRRCRLYSNQKVIIYMYIVFKICTECFVFGTIFIMKVAHILRVFSVMDPCFVVWFLMSFLVLQSCFRGHRVLYGVESWSGVMEWSTGVELRQIKTKTSPDIRPCQIIWICGCSMIFFHSKIWLHSTLILHSITPLQDSTP